MALLRETCERAVAKRTMADVPWGVLLSGRPGSSLVAALARRAFDAQGRTGAALHSFCIGLHGSPHMGAAQRVADFLGMTHHSFHFAIDEAIDAISDAIYHLETYDVATIAAGTPMFLLARKIKAMGIKMVLSGEGAAEVLGGYPYIQPAPKTHRVHENTVAKLQNLHLYDCLRANKAMSAWGVEARLPFLDRAVVDCGLSLDAAAKTNVDGASPRRAFDTLGSPYLPRNVLWRREERDDAGVGGGWIDALRAHAADRVSDRRFAQRAQRFPLHTPPTKAAYFLREVFERHFPSAAAAQTVHGGAAPARAAAYAEQRRTLGALDDAYDELGGVASGRYAAEAAAMARSTIGSAAAWHRRLAPASASSARL